MNKILDKIHALLQKTENNGASQAEAIEAAKLAQRLMAKYHVEISDYEEQAELIGESEIPVSRFWMRSLATAIAANTCCETLIKKRGRKVSVVFFGRDTDRKTAISMFNMFRELIRKGAREMKYISFLKFGSASNVEIVYATKYVSAVEDELGTQCRALALVPSDEVMQEFNQRYPNLKDSRNSQQFSKEYNVTALQLAAIKGYADGRDAAKRRAIEV